MEATTGLGARVWKTSMARKISSQASPSAPGWSTFPAPASSRSSPWTAPHMARKLAYASHTGKHYELGPLASTALHIGFDLGIIRDDARCCSHGGSFGLGPWHGCRGPR